MQPSVEDVLLSAIPGLPKVHLHNPVLVYEIGEDFMKFFYQAEEGKLDPFVLVARGSTPNEELRKEGYWAAVGTSPQTGQPGSLLGHRHHAAVRSFDHCLPCSVHMYLGNGKTLETVHSPMSGHQLKM
jgi:hypothetical protein